MNVIVGKNARVTFYDCLLRKSMLRIAPAAAREKLMTNLLLTTSVRDYVTNAKVEYCQKLKGVAAALMIRNCAIHIKRRMTE